jgi:Flp pilus assembly protein TadG
MQPSEIARMRRAGRHTRRPRLPVSSWRRPGERGQAIIEFTFFFVFIMFLLAGVVDIGGLLNAHLAIVYASRQGARTGSAVGPIATADCAIVGAIHSALLAQPNLTVTSITIYKSGPDGQPTTNSSGQLAVDVYPGAVNCNSADVIVSTQTGNPVAASPDNWDPATDPTARSVTPFAEDTLGVQLQYTYTFHFSLLGATFSASDYAVFPMEPSGGSST